MNRKTTLTLLALVVGIVAVSGVSAFGLMQNEEAKQALEAGDYDGFIQAVTTERSERFAEKMTVERFEKMQEMHAGKQDIQQALEDGDYQAWVEARESMPRPPGLVGIVTEENFDTFVAMHEAKQSGDLETARELAEELGLGQFPGNHKFKKGMHGFGKGCPFQ